MIRLDKINKYFFKNKKNQIHVINDTSLELPEKGLIILLGPSGSGKTTLLNVIGGLDTFETGSLTIDDLKLTKSNYKNIERIRNTEIGYVFQDYKLIDDMTVFGNVALSLKMCGVKDKNEVNNRVNKILELLGIYRYRNRKALMLSGGERQRVSIARAIVKDPRIVICDEPTGNLDSKKTVEIMNILKAISKSRLVLLVSHESDIAKFYSDRIIEIKDGKIVKDYENNVDGELNYEIANKIYLKDMKHYYKFKDKGIDLNVYSNEEDKIKINLVIRNNNIYIETEDVSNVELIGNNSSFELIDDHYKGISSTSINEHSFDIKEIPNKKRTSIYNFISMLKTGWYNLFKTNRMKTVTLVFTALSAVFVLYAMSIYLGAKEIHKEDYLYMDEAYLQIEVPEGINELYNELKSRDDIIHIEPLDFDMNYKMPLTEYYQPSMQDPYSDNRYLSSKDLISKDDIIYGELTDKDDEIVIDLNLFKRSYGIKQAVSILGIKDAEYIIGKKIVDYNTDNEYTITGIIDNKSNSIYFNSDEIDRLSDKGLYSFGQINVYTEDGISPQVITGTSPNNLFEILLPDVLSSKYNIGDTYKLPYSDKNEFIVSGFFESEDPDYSYASLETIKYISYSNRRFLYVVPKDANTFMEEFGSKYEIHFVASEEFEVYDLERKEAIANSTFLAAMFVIITFAFVILMTRASFLSRIKEVGVLRAVGVSKGDIIRMFVGETLVLITIGGAIGIGGMHYVLSLLMDIELFDIRIVINPFISILCFILLVLFYLLVVLIPISLVIRKTPAEILSRKDI